MVTTIRCGDACPNTCNKVKTICSREAGSRPLLHRLFGSRVDICWQTHGGDTAPSWGDIGPLHAACFNGDIGAVRVLLECGADVDAVVYSAARTTPLHEACLGGHDAVVR